MAQTRRKIELPRSRRNYRFTLTPLADTMFQLLVFFMLSANLTPYSILTLRTGTLGAVGPAQSAQASPAGQSNIVNPMASAVWSINSDSIVANGQRFALDRIPDLAQALHQQGVTEVLLISQKGATLQALVSILEVLAAHQITAVRVADGSAT